MIVYIVLEGVTVRKLEFKLSNYLPPKDEDEDKTNFNSTENNRAVLSFIGLLLRKLAFHNGTLFSNRYNLIK